LSAISICNASTELSKTLLACLLGLGCLLFNGCHAGLSWVLAAEEAGYQVDCGLISDVVVGYALAVVEGPCIAGETVVSNWDVEDCLDGFT
jgi:hypothetical protein